MSEDNEKIFGGIKDKLIVWELGNAVTGVTGVDHENNDNVEEFVYISAKSSKGHYCTLLLL